MARRATHGTVNSYKKHGCRCQRCTDANRAAKARYRQGTLAQRTVDRAVLRELLDELFPFGLTDDCPARRQRIAA